VSTRLDRALVERGLVRSRNQGREFILDGLVLVAGQVVTRPAELVGPQQEILLAPAASRQRVGRGYDKLRRFLEGKGIDFNQRHVVDGGAASGGFSQLALERGAASVLAVELGRGQLAADLRGEPRLRALEAQDIRAVTTLPAPCDILMLDLSFISLRNVLPKLRLPLAPRALLIALVKPQFEAPPSALTAGGRLRDPELGERLLAAVLECARAEGWEPLASEAVEPGPDQRQREYFVLARRLGAAAGRGGA
jgi:23S rRNA (cytidine1920-2'-O)/16S rRNA (cytidine1409-2'-O)-methyltransferase